MRGEEALGSSLKGFHSSAQKESIRAAGGGLAQQWVKVATLVPPYLPQPPPNPADPRTAPSDERRGPTRAGWRAPLPFAPPLSL